jgi:hypothetical protein
MMAGYSIQLGSSSFADGASFTTMAVPLIRSIRSWYVEVDPQKASAQAAFWRGQGQAGD